MGKGSNTLTYVVLLAECRWRDRWAALMARKGVRPWAMSQVS